MRKGVKGTRWKWVFECGLDRASEIRSGIKSVRNEGGGREREREFESNVSWPMETAITAL